MATAITMQEFFNPHAVEFEQIAGVSLPTEILRQLKMMMSEVELARLPHGMVRDAVVGFGPDATVFDDEDADSFYDALHLDEEEKRAPILWNARALAQDLFIRRNHKHTVNAE
jgi:hypothetical protein